jgi:signal transduction histidine kinase
VHNLTQLHDEKRQLLLSFQIILASHHVLYAGDYEACYHAVVSCFCAACCLQERISFNPHPKTLTMAGDYEYFAAQGHHPLAFALAELIDNALRATKGNSERPRSITVSLVTDEKGGKGMVCVRDNGSGMTVQELNNWAVMNLSMEDRGLLNTDEEKSE